MEGKKKSALIIVDVQPMFIGEGNSQTPTGAAIVPVINALIPIFDNIIVSCHNWIPESPACNPHLGLRLDSRAVFIHKNSCDAFEGEVYNAQRKKTYLPEHKLLPLLRARKVEEVFVCGVFTEWCVKETAISAVKFGFKTHIVEPACAGKTENGIKDAMKAMSVAGVLFKGLADCIHETKHPPELAALL